MVPQIAAGVQDSLDRRLTEAAKLGFTAAVVPRSPTGLQKATTKAKGIKILECTTVSEALHAVLGTQKHKD